MIAEQAKWTRERSRWCLIWPRPLSAVSLPDVWAETAHFDRFRKILRVLRGYFDHQRAGPVLKGTLRSRSRTSRPSHLVRNGAACVFLGEVVKVYPPWKWKVCDLTACLRGKKRSARDFGEGLEKNDENRKNLNMSITEGGMEGNSKVIASCTSLEEMFQECTNKKKRRVGLASSVETLEVVFRTNPQEQMRSQGGGNAM